MNDKYTNMELGELKHMARINEAMAAALLQTAYEMMATVSFEDLINDASDKSGCEISQLWAEVKVATENEIQERIEEEFTDVEIEHIKSLIAAGKL